MSLHIVSSANARQNRSILADMIYFFMLPRNHIFIMVIGGLLVSGLLKLYLPALVKVSWLVNLSGFYLFGFSIILFIHRGGRFLPPVLIWALILLAYGIVTSLVNGIGLVELLATMKRYFSGWGLFLVMYVIYFSSPDIERIKKFLYLLIFFQLFFCLHQYFVLVPLRETFELTSERNITPVDVITGTFGAHMYGAGANGTLALFLIIALSMLLSLKNTQISPIKYISILVIILIPLFLGETKIVVIYLIVVLFIVYGKNFIQNPFKFIVNIILIFSLIGALSYIYIVKYKHEHTTAAGKIDNIVAKNFGDIGRAGKELNRTTTLTFWVSEQRYFSWLNTLLGHGLGATFSGKKGDEFSASVAGSLSRRYPNYGINYTTISIMLWELGIVGILLFVCLFSSVWMLVKRIEYTAPESILYQINGLKVATIVFIIDILAKPTFTHSISHQVLFAVFMSYLIILRYRSNDL
ncbi:MAG: hypothetical protein ABFS56_11855 [Pseudomonadota bacterium]